MPHCHLLQTGDIQAIVGDASRCGAGGTQYCGLWSLASKHRVFNAFGNSYAGLLPGEIRGKAPRLDPLDEVSCTLWRKADNERPADVRALYSLTPPHYVDHELVLRDRRDLRAPGCDFREVSWCCYMNSPADPRLHFLSDGEWYRYVSPSHGVASNIAPAYVAHEQLEQWPDRGPDRPFHWDRHSQRFDQPFYYGRLDHMVLLLVFDTPEWLRFFCSPSGGGHSLLPGQTCPAWDFEWVIPDSEYEVGREYRFRVRLVYKEYVSDEDVLDEVGAAREELSSS